MLQIQYHLTLSWVCKPKEHVSISSGIYILRHVKKKTLYGSAEQDSRHQASSTSNSFRYWKHHSISMLLR